MKAKKLLIAGFATMAILCSSCGISREATGNQNVTQTEVVLAKKNYKVIGTVKGESKQNYWLMFGGMSKASMNQSAMSEMYKNANLTGSQAIINVNVTMKNKSILIYNQAKAVATGTVIEFID